jgi:hypothetical protein
MVKYRIDIPKVFPKMGQWLDFHLLDYEGQNVIDFALSELNKGEMKELRTFFKLVLASPLTLPKLQEVWSRGQTNIYIRKENELRGFIAEIIRKIDLTIGPDAAP